MQIITDENEYYNVSVILSVGGRSEMQDRFGCVLKKEKMLAVICDGMGGMEHGEMAAETAIDTIVSGYDNSSDISPAAFLDRTVSQANEKICSLTDGHGRKIDAGSTVTAVLINDRQLSWCSVGDSRLYISRGKQHILATQDHIYRTVLDKKLKESIISREYYISELPKADLLISYLGMGPDILKDYNDTPISLKSGDTVILMTDGLYKTLDEQDIFSVIQSNEVNGNALSILEEMADKEAKAGNISRDNMTVAIITIK